LVINALSLRFKLSLSIALILAFSMGTLSFVAWRSMSNNAQESIARSAESMKATIDNRLLEIAQVSALETSSLLNRNFDVALHLASILSGTAHGSGTPYTRVQVKKMTYDMLVATPSASSIPMLFKALPHKPIYSH
jgi:methyl-accepting chemotaxis protein